VSFAARTLVYVRNHDKLGTSGRFVNLNRSRRGHGSCREVAAPLALPLRRAAVIALVHTDLLGTGALPRIRRARERVQRAQICFTVTFPRKRPARHPVRGFALADPAGTVGSKAV
jgi:hypothetical protein